jgi:5-methylthioadenosine/S-adenosylhomocysteine deaminase
MVREGLIMKVLIKNCSILTLVTADDVYTVGQIEIENDRITYAGTVRDTGCGSFDRVIDGRGMLALPGLINCHTHSSMSLMRGYGDDMPLMKWLNDRIWPIEEGLTEEDVYWGAALSIAEMLKSGTTAFADMYFFMDGVARIVEESGIRADLSFGMVSFGDDWKERIQNSSRFYKEWNDKADGRITVSLGPHAPYTCVPDFLAMVKETAKELGAKVHIHLAETTDEIQQIRDKYNKTPIEYVNDIGLFDSSVIAAHCVHLIDDDMRIMKEKGVNAVHNPQSNAKLASGIAPVEQMLKMGINVALGTDSSCSNNNLDMISEMRAAALLQKVGNMDAVALPAFKAVQMATVNGAKALGQQDMLGMIKAGMKADIILVDMNKPHLYPQHDLISNLVYAANGSDVAYTMVDGKVLVDKGQLVTLDIERIYYEVDRSLKRLFNR